MNYLKGKFAKYANDLTIENALQVPSGRDPEEELSYKELKEVIQEGIKLLPDRCRTIFLLSRRAGHSYSEIASDLDISIKTVERQMGIALKKLRTYVDAYQASMFIAMASLPNLF